MARRRPRVYVQTSRVFSVRLRGATEWEVKTVASLESSFDQERRYWNGRGYETRVEVVHVETTYPAVDAVPLEEWLKRDAA